VRYWNNHLRGEDNVFDFGTKFQEYVHLDGGSLPTEDDCMGANVQVFNVATMSFQEYRMP
jgi:hypothetical protein